MQFITLIIRWLVALRNYFSSKHFQVELLGNVILIYRTNPEVVIKDYYFYIYCLLKSNLTVVNKRCIVLYDFSLPQLLKKIFPIFEISLQIEHTLVKPGGRESNLAKRGELPIPNSDDYYLIRIDNLKKQLSANFIFEYSRINYYNIRSDPNFKHFFKKMYCISPTLYPINTVIDGRKGVITVFGNPNEARRKTFLEALAKQKILSRNIQNVYSDIDVIYRDIKIMINIRQTDHHDTLEELRVLPALRSGVIVICESAPFAEKTWYSKFIIWGALADLPKIVMDVEKNYNDYHNLIFGSVNSHSAFRMRMKRIEQCNQLAVLRMTNRMNNNNCKLAYGGDL